ncbi:MAG: 3-dehydroquinate synthase [Oscillospiraceae bacterium]|jgi:3-dehydroquinate synthase|nr:3-dehydroquinate synthase [Oscillospiraceae bacterium]
MRIQRVALKENGYDILFARLAAFGGLLRERLAPRGAVAVVSDETVWAAQGTGLAAALDGAGLPYRVCLLPPGEQTKTLDGLQRLYAFFAEAGVRRDGLVVAFGGGVVGDLTGFAAATWMRGVPYVQIPTTLLAQVDSSVGGKTAVDLPQGKNLAGAFYQPALVLLDVETLDTLAPRELRCGMAEVIKYGAIYDAALFDRLRVPPQGAALEDIVAECCRLKANVVAEDERDTGARMLLNFGHTFGHAAETLGGYETYKHGEAVALGMVLAAEAGALLGVTPPGCAAALGEILQANGLESIYPLRPSTLLPVMRLDKKNDGGGLRLVLLRDIGSAFVYPIAEEALTAVLERMDAAWTPV